MAEEYITYGDKKLAEMSLTGHMDEIMQRAGLDHEKRKLELEIEYLEHELVELKATLKRKIKFYNDLMGDMNAN